jgi:hypothetical protein
MHYLRLMKADAEIKIFPSVAVAICGLHGYRCHFTGEHANRHDGQHLSKNRGNTKRMAKTGLSGTYNAHIKLDYA